MLGRDCFPDFLEGLIEFTSPGGDSFVARRKQTLLFANRTGIMH